MQYLRRDKKDEEECKFIQLHSYVFFGAIEKELVFLTAVIFVPISDGESFPEHR